MIEWQDTGIVLSARPHGETGGIISLLTENHGRAQGYLYGAASSRMRGTTEIGTRVDVQWQAKGAGQLGQFKLELEKSAAGDVIGDPLKLTALQAACTLVDKTLPENEKHRAIYDGTKALLDAFAGEYWAVSYIFWEIALLKELGFGLDLSRCVSTGETENLLYVSPKSGCAVSKAAGEIYKEKLLKLPTFLRGEAQFGDQDILDGFNLTGYFLLHRVFLQSYGQLPEARQRLHEKFAKNMEAAGL